MPNASRGATLRMHLNALVEAQPGGTYLAHCLELDLVAEGASPHDACDELLNLIEVQIRTCVENDNLEHLFFRAPEADWEKLERLRGMMQPHTHRRTIAAQTGRCKKEVELNEFCYA